ncbi:uncharacterized protein LOC129713800 isoform X2 [Leucoraja erinacea]|uniref:uncharacterized protein LOC129713800 isoform X2 n=1 Tax=Leucoraja erinaceus TaxID=7782 RepID=UPI002457557C|nr:uncharacterized protein LOC129713800 isoform X2 [Leucoraja erinacea]
MTSYLEKHYPGILSNDRGKLKPSEWKEFVNKKALEIEKKDGRGKVTVVFKKIGPKANEKSSGVKIVGDQPVVELECKRQETKATSETIKPPTPASNEDTKPKSEVEPISASVCKITGDEASTEMYLYPDGLPITRQLHKKMVSKSVRAPEGTSAKHDAGTANNLHGSLGSKVLEDHIKQLDFDETIIGLDFLTEYNYKGKTEPLYYCELCNCESPLRCILAHMFGLKHKTNYVKWKHPYLLEATVGKYKQIVEEKAAEIEKIDGRGTVKVVFDKISPMAIEKSSGVKRVGDQPVVELECKRQKTKATSEKTKQPMPASNEDTKPKSEVEPISSSAGIANNLQGSLGSKVLDDHIKQSDFDKTIIGLDFLTEYHYKGKTEPLYYCELCNCELPLRCILAHIFGLKHKSNYVKRKHPDLLKATGGKYKQLVKEKTAEMEKIDGRGTVKVVRDHYGIPLSERRAGTKYVLGNQLPDTEYSSFDQDQCTNMETSQSSDPRNRKPYASISSKPSGSVTSSRAVPWSDPKYSQHESSTTKCDLTGKRDFKDIRHSGEDWRDELEQTIKRSKLHGDDEREREKSKYSAIERDKWQESKCGSRYDYIKSDKSRSYRDNDHQEHDARYWAPEKYVPLRPEDIAKKDILGFLANLEVLNDTDARYVKGIMYKLSNRLLQFGQRAMQLRGSADKLSEQMKKPSLADQHSRYECRGARTLVNYSDQPARQNSAASMSLIRNNLLTPSLLNSIRGMDVNTVTSTLTRLAANNPEFEGIRISTLVTVLMETGVLGQRPN